MERTIDALATMKQDITCPQCKNEFVVNISGQPGTYTPTCPKCNYNFRIKLKQPLLSIQQHKSKLKYDVHLPMGQKSKVPIIIGAIAIVAIVVIAAAFFSILSHEEKKESKTVTMTYQEHIDDWGGEIDYDNYIIVSYLKSVDDGDILKIKDTIVKVSYSGDEDITSVCFRVDSSYGGFSFEGNLTEEYGLNDTVIITLHIIYVCYEKVLGNTTWTIKGDTFEEMFDRNTYETKHLSASCIELIEKG